MTYLRSLTVMLPVAFALSASQLAGHNIQSEIAASAPPRSAGEQLITELTWPGIGGEQASKGEFAPRDECGQVDGAYQFRIKLADAVIARDVDAVVAMAKPMVKLSFGGDYGRETLREWLSEPNSELWQELEAVLRLGCAADSPERITMPWYFNQDIGERDPYGAYIVTGSDIPLYKGHSGEEIVEKLNWAMVDLAAFYEILEQKGNRDEVILTDGRRGYVDKSKLRALISYRMGVVKNEAGEWKISTFLAGD